MLCYAMLCCAVLYYIDLAVLCIQSRRAAAFAGHFCSYSCVSLIIRCSPILLPICSLSLADPAGQSCEVETDVSHITFLPLLRVVVVAHYPCLGCGCYVVVVDIVAAGQACEWL
jgi:hypothetical protein